MYIYNVLHNALSSEDRQFYLEENAFRKLVPTGDLLVETLIYDCNSESDIKDNTMYRESTTYVVFNGDITPLYGCRDCGEYYIVAHAYQLYKIFKSDLSICFPVESDN